VKEPHWVPVEAVRAMHLELLAEHGGLPGVRDVNLLESALARPKNLWAYEHPTMAELAASYGFGLAKNRPFADGNKRIALAVVDTFLGMNGYDFVVPEAEAADTIRGLAAGTLSQNELAHWLAAHTRKVRS
jgi:death-on-curing protein